MSTLYLPAQLRDLTEGSDGLHLEGDRVADVLTSLRERYPKTSGWLTDEQGQLRPHVKVFLNGEVVGLYDSVGEGDEIRILPAISGGSDSVELLVGTRKGLFVLRGDRGSEMEVAARAFEGLEVEYAIKDPRSGTYMASVTNSYFGPRIYLADDPTGKWEHAEGPSFPEGAGATVKRIWSIQPGEKEGLVWAGIAPAALFRSDDGGRLWSRRPVPALHRHVAGRSSKDRDRYLCRRCLDNRRRGSVLAPSRRGFSASLRSRRCTRDQHQFLRAQPASLPRRARHALHAVPRRCLPLRRLRRNVERHWIQWRSALRLRLSPGSRSA